MILIVLMVGGGKGGAKGTSEEGDWDVFWGELNRSVLFPIRHSVGRGLANLMPLPPYPLTFQLWHKEK